MYINNFLKNSSKFEKKISQRVLEIICNIGEILETDKNQLKRLKHFNIILWDPGKKCINCHDSAHVGPDSHTNF